MEEEKNIKRRGICVIQFVLLLFLIKLSKVLNEIR